MPTAKEMQSALLRVAGDHFAARGYQGASLARIAADLGITKQGVLHHCRSKEQLYKVVLHQLGQDLVKLLFAAMDQAEEPEVQLELFFVSLFEFFRDQNFAPALLIGILIDGPGQSVYASDTQPALQDLLEPLVALIQATDRWQDDGFPVALTVAFELLGAACLFPAARAGMTLRFGKDQVAQAEEGASRQFRVLVQELIQG